MVRVAERATGQTLPAVARELDRICTMDLQGSSGRVASACASRAEPR
jgi:hypothetical protein